MSKESKSNATAFEKLKAELKTKFPFLVDVYFDDHHGFWMTNTKEESMEHNDFEEVFNYLLVSVPA